MEPLPSSRRPVRLRFVVAGGGRLRPLPLLAATVGLALGLVAFAGPAESAAKTARKKLTTCTAAEVAAPVLKGVSTAAPIQVQLDNVDPSNVQCLNNKNPELTFRVITTLSLSKPGAARGSVTGSLITEVGFPKAAVQRVEGRLTGSYRCKEGTCSVNARATKSGKAIASLKGTLKATGTRFAEYEEISFTFQNITWSFQSGASAGSD